MTTPRQMTPAGFPLRREVTVLVFEIAVNDFGESIKTRVGEYKRPVLGWYAPEINAAIDDNANRRIDFGLVLIAPPETADIDSQVRIEGTTYRVAAIKDHRHGPWFNPGLVVYELKEETG